MKGLIVTLIVLAALGAVVVVQYVSYKNTFTELNNQYNAQLSENQTIFDEVWKVIAQQAQISDKYADDFKSVYVDMMEARNYGGEAFKWIQEQNPAFSQDMYMKLMNTIESERVKFTMSQKKLIAVHQEMQNLTQRIPSSFFLMGEVVPDLVIVTSTKTERTFATGKEDDVNLF